MPKGSGKALGNHRHTAAYSTIRHSLRLIGEHELLALRWMINEFANLFLLCFFLYFYFFVFRSFHTTHRFLKELQYGGLDGSSY